MTSIRTQDPEIIIEESAARHFAVVIVNDKGRMMYWTGRGFDLFDDSQGGFLNIKLLRDRDASMAYYGALNSVSKDASHAGSSLQLVAIPIMGFSAS